MFVLMLRKCNANSIMNTSQCRMLLIDTIEEDTEIPDLEDGSSGEEDPEETVPEEKQVGKKKKQKVKTLPKKKKKISDFSSDFCWEEADVNMDEVEENFEKEMQSLSKGKIRLQDNTSAKLTALSNEVQLSDHSEDEKEEEEEGEGDTAATETATEAAKKEKSKFFTEAPEQDLNVKFSEMNLSRPLLKGVAALGFAHPTPIQASAIPLALLGKDLCACAVTGSGKTAAYVLPILERLLYKPKSVSVTRVLILVPTRELGIQVQLHFLSFFFSFLIYLETSLICRNLEF